MPSRRSEGAQTQQHSIAYSASSSSAGACYSITGKTYQHACHGGTLGAYLDAASWWWSEALHVLSSSGLLLAGLTLPSATAGLAAPIPAAATCLLRTPPTACCWFITPATTGLHYDTVLPMSVCLPRQSVMFVLPVIFTFLTGARLHLLHK